MEYVLVGCRFLIGVVFLVSAAGKIRGRDAYAAFRRAAGELAPRVPPRLRSLVPSAVVAGELAAVVLLAVPATVAAGFALAVVLLAAFTAAIVAAVRARRQVACNCFGTSSAPVGPAQIIRNTALLTASLAGVVLAAGGTPAALEPAGVVAAVVAALTGAGLVLLTDDVAELFRPLT